MQKSTVVERCLVNLSSSSQGVIIGTMTPLYILYSCSLSWQVIRPADPFAFFSVLDNRNAGHALGI
jgi:hypothetical protein